MNQEQAKEMIQAAASRFNGGNGNQETRIAKLLRISEQHPGVQVVACRDENTGRRFGTAKCRKGRCEKIGQSAFSRRGRRLTPYQIWAVWE